MAVVFKLPLHIGNNIVVSIDKILRSAYTFSGKPYEYGVCINRNGRYRAYKINTDKLHIEMGDINEV